MKKNSKVISTLLITATLTTLGTTVFAGETNEVIKEKILAGATRYESAIEVSKEGWKSSETAVLVNGAALPDALAATPYAKMKDAPILLTEGNKLTDVTKEELRRLNVKNVTIVGGDGVVSKNIEIELQNMGIDVERIAGSDRFETSIKVAKKLDAKSVAVVNGLNGRMSDAMSIASPAAENKMAIILSDGNNLRNGENFIADNGITNAYVIGGEGVVSDNIVSKLNAKRLGGINRLETNAIVLKEFYNEKEIKNLYTAKDGSGNEGQLVDALAAGALASKENAPVMLVGSHVSDVQKQFLTEKQIKTVTRVGYGINDSAIEEIYDVLKVVRGIDVTTVKELQKALETAKKNDLVKFSPKDTITESYNIKSNKELTVELNGKHTGTITVDMPNGDIINNGELTYDVIVNDIKDGTFINNGRIKSMNVSDTNGSSILNTDKATIDKVVVNEKAKLSVSGKISEISIEGKDAQLKINKDSEIEKLQVKEKGEGSLIENEGKIKKAIIDKKAENVKVDNEKGKIDKLEGNKESIICGKENIETITSAGAGGGSGSSGGGSSTTTPSDSKKDIKIARDKYFATVKKYTDLKGEYTENSWTKFNEFVQKETIKVDDKNTTVKIINEAEETIKLEAEKLVKKDFAEAKKLLEEKIKYAQNIVVNEKASDKDRKSLDNSIIDAQKIYELEKDINKVLKYITKLDKAIENFNSSILKIELEKESGTVSVKDLLSVENEKSIKIPSISLELKENSKIDFKGVHVKEAKLQAVEGATIQGGTFNNLKLNKMPKKLKLSAMKASLLDEKIENVITLDKVDAKDLAIEKGLKVKLSDCKIANMKIQNEVAITNEDNIVEVESEYNLRIAKAIEDKIATLPSDILLEHDEMIKNTREEYDSLTENQQKFVGNLVDLESAEEKIDQLKSEISISIHSMNTASKEEMGKVLGEKAEILGLDLSSYEKLTNKEAVNYGLVGKNFVNPEAIQEEINKLVKNQEEVEKVMYALTAINKASKEEMGKVLGEKAEILGLDLSSYEKLTNKEAVNYRLVGKNFVNPEAIQEEINKLVKNQEEVEKVMYALTAINTASKEEMGKVLGEKAEILGLDLSSYEKLTNKEAVNYGLVGKNFVNPEAIQEEINKLVKNQEEVEKVMYALTAINKASKEEMGKVLGEKAEILGLDLSSYEKLTNKEAVNYGLVGKNFVNPEAIQEEINKLVKNQEEVEKVMYALTAINKASKEEMGKVLGEKAEILGLDLSSYEKLTNKEAVNYGLVGKNFVNPEAIQEEINKLVKNQEDVEKVMYALTAINKASKEEMGKVLGEKAEILELDLSSYEKLTNKEAVNYRLVGKNFVNPEAIQEEINKLVKNQEEVEKVMYALTAINKASKEEMGKVLGEKAEILGLDLSSYEKLTNKEAVNYGLVGKNFVNPEAIQEEINKLVKNQEEVEKVMYALTAINKASKEEMGKVLGEKAEILGLDLSSYEKLTNKEAVNYGLVGKNFVNPEAIQEEINKLVEEVKNEINIKFENNKLSWNEVEGAISYSVSILGNEDFTVEDLEKINEIDINNTNLRSGKYDVYVTVKFNDGAKKQSNKKEIEYKKADIQEISNLKFDEETKMLEWDSIENIENYTIFIYDNVQGSLVDESGKKLDENNYVVTKENNVHFKSIENIDYTFCVKANFQDGKSICSYLERKIVGKPYEEKELLKSPENIKVNNNIITWNKVENAIGYRITLIGENDFSNDFVEKDILNYEIGEECRLIPGDYIVRIVSIADENSNYGNSENNSEEAIYSKNKKVLQVPNEVKVDEGILTWNKVEHAKEYFIKIENDIESKIISVSNDKTSLDLKNEKLPVGVNKISICACSNEYMYIKSSDYSNVIDYNVKEEEYISNENLNSKTATSLLEKAFTTIATLFIK